MLSWPFNFSSNGFIVVIFNQKLSERREVVFFFIKFINKLIFAVLFNSILLLEVVEHINKNRRC